RSDEVRDRLVLGDRRAQRLVEREAMIDQAPVAIRHEPAGARPGNRTRPGEDATPRPDLDGGDVVLPEDALSELRVLAPRNLDLIVVDEQGVHDAVDVAGERGLLGVE